MYKKKTENTWVAYKLHDSIRSNLVRKERNIREGSGLKVESVSAEIQATFYKNIFGMFMTPTATVAPNCRAHANSAPN